MFLAALSFCLPLLAAAQVEVQGHRGARGARPENTIPAFLYAIQNGADAIEMDMHVTKDGVIVITHDHYLNPEICAGPHGARITKKILVRSLTFQELERYDCGALVNPKFPQQKPVPGTRIPSLDAVFRAVEKSGLPRAKTVQYNIETKSEEDHPEYNPAPLPFVKLFLAVVKKHHLLSRVILESFDYRTLKVAHEKEPALRLAMLVGERPAGLHQLAESIPGTIFSPSFDWITKEDVAEMHQLHRTVLVWTPNEKADWEKLIGMGVDGIITDYPQDLLAWLKSAPNHHQ